MSPAEPQPGAQTSEASGPHDAEFTVPPPPNPSSDPRLVDQAQSQDPTSPQLANVSDDIFEVPPLAALKQLSIAVENLVRITGDIPPTPPPSSPHQPTLRGLHTEKSNIVRSHSEKNLARLREQALRDQRQKEAERQAQGRPEQGRDETCEHTRPPANEHPSFGDLPSQLQHPSSAAIDGVHLKPSSTTPISPTQAPTPPEHDDPSSPPPPPPPPQPYVVIGQDSQPLNMQHSAITRKFYSKNPPPISIDAYLVRIHRFCPMSTAVYLAASLYIHRLAVEERAMVVTGRNAHRLLLAGLRVAMKALEDLSYPHAKFARVGGVSERELARLEVNFCFLAGFELCAGEEKLRRHWAMLRQGCILRGLEETMPVLRIPRLPSRREWEAIPT